MAPRRKPWFRFYVEALTDPKLRRLSVEERWLWVAVLGAARQSPVPGWLMLTEALPLSADDLAELAGMTPAKVQKGLDRMLELGIVNLDRDTGAFRVTAWADRQFDSDDTTARTRKHRRNTEPTTMERSINGDRADDGTPSESESETEEFSSSPTTPTRAPTEAGDEDDDPLIRKLAQRRLDDRRQATHLDPIGDEDRWLATAVKRERARAGDVAAARLRFPEAGDDALVAYLVDGTEPPPPPQLLTCRHCGAGPMDHAAYQDHLESCASVGAEP